MFTFFALNPGLLSVQRELRSNVQSPKDLHSLPVTYPALDDTHAL